LAKDDPMEYARQTMATGVDPSLGVAMQTHWRAFFEGVRQLDFGPLQAEVDSVIAKLYMIGTERTRAVANVAVHGRNALRAVIVAVPRAAQFVSNITNSTMARPETRRIVTKIIERVHEQTAAVTDDVVMPVRLSGRRLMSFGSWLYEEVVGCELLVATGKTFTESGDLLHKYYGTNFQESIVAFGKFNTTHTPSVSAIPAGSNSLKEILALDQLETLVNNLADGNITPTIVLDSAITFLTCDPEAVMLCSNNAGLIRKSKFVILLMTISSAIVHYTIPMSMTVILTIWALYIPFAVYAAYGVSPTCFPMIPTCLAGDIRDVFASLIPARGTLEIVRLINAFNSNNHTMATCDQPEYGFRSITGNIAYSGVPLNWNLGSGATQPGGPSVTNSTIPGGDSFFAGWFPVYHPNTTNDDTYRMCNYVTSVRNSGYAVVVVGLIPAGVALLVSGALSVAMVMYVLAYGIFMGYALYVGKPAPKPMKSEDEHGENLTMKAEKAYNKKVEPPFKRLNNGLIAKLRKVFEKIPDHVNLHGEDAIHGVLIQIDHATDIPLWAIRAALGAQRLMIQLLDKLAKNGMLDEHTDSFLMDPQLVDSARAMTRPSHNDIGHFV
jgi:hypothetical protein